MSETNTAMDKVKEAIKNDTIKVDDARVKITEMQLDAIRELQNNKNEIFSELSVAETNDVTKAYVFAADPTPALNLRLKKLNIEMKIELPVLTTYLDRTLELRHCTGRQRVDEYIKAISAVSPKLLNQERQETPQGIFGRGRII